MANKSNKRKKFSISKEDIVHAAMELANRDGWSRVRIMHLSSHLNLPIADVIAQFQDMNAIADFWFERAALVVGRPTEENFEAKSPADRLFEVIVLWLMALEPYRKVSAEMIAEKLYPSHPHHWAPLVFSLSRLVHLFLDAALINSFGRQRQAEELGTTILIMSTLRVWSRDQSDDQHFTREHLSRSLRRGERFMSVLFGRK